MGFCLNAFKTFLSIFSIVSLIAGVVTVIVYATTMMDNQTMWSCRVDSDHPFCIVPLSEDHKKITFSPYSSYDEDDRSFFIVDPLGASELTNWTDDFSYEGGCTVRNRTVTLYQGFTAGRNSVVSISFSTTRSVDVLIFRWEDVRLYVDETYNGFGLGYDQDYCPRFKYSKRKVSKAIFNTRKKGRGPFSMTWIAPETSSFVIALGNDSPFQVTTMKCNTSIQYALPKYNSTYPISSFAPGKYELELSVPKDFPSERAAVVTYDS